MGTTYSVIETNNSVNWSALVGNIKGLLRRKMK